MLHKNTHIIAIIGGIFLVVSGVVCGVFFYVVDQQKADYIESSTAQAGLQARHKAIAELAETLDATQAERASLISRILKDEDTIALVALIESLEQEQGIESRGQTLATEPINATFATLVISKSVRGTYASLMQYLKTLEQLPYQVVLSTVDLNRSDGVEWSATIEIRITTFMPPAV